jgi:hypothetical protein
MIKLNDPQIELVASRIVKHLLENPNKKDTLRGICEWWLLQERIDYTINIVTTAIELLLTKNFIIEKTIVGSEKIYQLNKKKYNDILKVFDLEREILAKTE